MTKNLISRIFLVRTFLVAPTLTCSRMMALDVGFLNAKVAPYSVTQFIAKTIINSVPLEGATSAVKSGLSLMIKSHPQGLKQEISR